MDLVDADGVVRGTRELASAQPACDELFDATALAISIALDASGAIAAPPPEPLQPEAAAPPPAPMVESLAPEPPPPREAPPAAPAHRPIPLFAGIDVLESIGTAPSIALSGEAFAGVRSGLFSLALGFRGDAPAASGAIGGGGRVESWLFSATAAPCAHVGVLLGCVVAALGSLEARGVEVSAPRMRSGLFAALGGRLGVELPLAGVWALRLRGDVLRNLYPTTFVLDQSAAWSSPSVIGDVGAGVVAHFP